MEVFEDHFPFQMGDGCRFRPLIFQGVSTVAGFLWISSMNSRTKYVDAGDFFPVSPRVPGPPSLKFPGLQGS